MKVQILFFEEQLEKQLVQPGIQVPVDQPQVIAGDVAAEIGKLDALAFAFAPPLAFHSPPKNLPGYQFQSLQLGQQRRREKFSSGSGHENLE